MQKLISFVIVLTVLSCSSDQKDENTQNDVAPKDSLSWLNAKIESDPTNLEAIFERSKIYSKKGEIELAENDLEYYMKLDSSNLNVHKLYADIKLAKLEIESSKYHYEFIIRKDSTNSSAYLGIGKIYAILNNNAAALAYLNQSLKMDPYQTESYFMKGMIYRGDFAETGRKESFDLALTSFQTAIEQDPNNYSAYVQLGVMYDQVGDSTAIDYYNSALDIYPNSLEAWYNKAMFYQNRGRLQEAHDCYQTIHEIDSTWADAYYNQGYIYLLIDENLDSAVYYFDKAVNFDPTFYQAYNNLGLTYEKKGDISRAKQFYTKAVEINPEFKLAKDNLNRLQ